MEEHNTIPLCQLCHQKTAPVLKKVFDDRYGYPKYFDIVRCEQCGLFQTSPRLSVFEIADLYTQYYTREDIDSKKVREKFHYRSDRAFRFKSWFEGNHRVHFMLPPGGGQTVLEVGSGDGSALLYLKTHGYDAYGIEPDRNIARVRDELGLNIHIGTIEDAPYRPETFDSIIANQLIEHIVDLDSFMANMKRLLKPGGKIILSTPNGRSVYRKILKRKWINWHVPYHQQIFDAVSMEMLAQKHGLSVNRAKTVTPLSWTLHNLHSWQKPWLSFGKPNPYWAASSASQPKPSVIQKKTLKQKTKRLVFLSATVFINFSNRLLDLSGQGDCLIIEIIKK